MILPSITFKKDYRVFKEGQTITFKNPITVITGDNGTGKSSLLGAIRNLFPRIKWTMSQDSSSKGVLKESEMIDVKASYLCLSKDLYANASEFDYDNMDVFLATMQLSSGQGAFTQLVDMLKNCADADLLIFDEPERGLSIAHQTVLCEIIRIFSEKYPKTQFIITTHSLRVMSLCDEVLSLNHGRFIDPTSYFNFINQPEAPLLKAQKIMAEAFDD